MKVIIFTFLFTLRSIGFTQNKFTDSLSHGEISVRSGGKVKNLTQVDNDGNGTTFTIKLPHNHKES